MGLLPGLDMRVPFFLDIVPSVAHPVGSVYPSNKGENKPEPVIGKVSLVAIDGVPMANHGIGAEDKDDDPENES
jgi:hypothetical protein